MLMVAATNQEVRCLSLLTSWVNSADTSYRGGCRRCWLVMSAVLDFGWCFRALLWMLILEMIRRILWSVTRTSRLWLTPSNKTTSCRWTVWHTLWRWKSLLWNTLSRWVLAECINHKVMSSRRWVGTSNKSLVILRIYVRFFNRDWKLLLQL